MLKSRPACTAVLRLYYCTLLYYYCTTTLLLLYYYCTTAVLLYYYCNTSYYTSVPLPRAPALKQVRPPPPKQVRIFRKKTTPHYSGFQVVWGGSIIRRSNYSILTLGPSKVNSHRNWLFARAGLNRWVGYCCFGAGATPITPGSTDAG